MGNFLLGMLVASLIWTGLLFHDDVLALIVAATAKFKGKPKVPPA